MSAQEESSRVPSSRELHDARRPGLRETADLDYNATTACHRGSAAGDKVNNNQCAPQPQTTTDDPDHSATISAYGGPATTSAGAVCASAEEKDFAKRLRLLRLEKHAAYVAARETVAAPADAPADTASVTVDNTADTPSSSPKGRKERPPPALPPALQDARAHRLAEEARRKEEQHQREQTLAATERQLKEVRAQQGQPDELPGGEGNSGNRAAPLHHREEGVVQCSAV